MLMEKVEKSISEIKYENLINYRICEIMYIHMKRTKYDTFSNMCSNIRDAVKATGNVGGELGNLVKLTLKELKILYALEHDEAVTILINFLENNLWERYQGPVMVFINKTPNSFQ